MPDSLLDIPPPGGFAGIPSLLQNSNEGKSNNQGVELALSARISDSWTVFGNYAWQDAPETEGINAVPHPSGQPIEPVNIPPKHRFNLGVFWDIRRFYANANVNYQDVAYWTDVLGPAFWGPTDSFAMVNLGLGTRLRGQEITIAVNAQNIFDERIQQHVWGDIISRKVTAQIVYRF